MESIRIHRRYGVTALLIAAAVVLTGISPPHAAAEPLDTVEDVAADGSSMGVEGVDYEINPADVSLPAFPSAGAARSGGVTSDCPAPEGDELVICERITKPTAADLKVMAEMAEQARGVGTASAAPAAIIPVPANCDDSPGYWAMTRTSACVFTTGSLTVERMIGTTRAVVGTARFTTYDYVYMSLTGLDFYWQTQRKFTSLTGEAYKLSHQPTGWCTFNRGCVSISTPGPIQALTVGRTDSYEYHGRSADLAYLLLNPGKLYRSWYYFAPSDPKIIPANGIQNSLTFRCDNAIYNRAPACVLPEYIPNISYSESGAFNEFASHVRRAQQSGLRGGSSTDPLRRITDETWINKNRSTSCGQTWIVRPPDGSLSCDEYPFASTSQGAWNYGWTAGRTFNGCGITLPYDHSTGALGFSVCLIDATQNSQAGNVLNQQMYVGQRVLDGDEFYVTITS